MTQFSTLVLSLAALVVAPGLAYFSAKAKFLQLLLQGFVVGSIFMLVAVELLPHAIEDAGAGALLAAAIGLVLPILLDRVLRGGAATTHRYVSAFWAIVLVLHGVLDGLAIAGSGLDLASVSSSTPPDLHVAHTHETLGLGIVLHRLPAALSIAWLLSKTPRLMSLTLSAIGLATLGGYYLAPDWLATSDLQVFGLFQAFVAGMLLHVVFHDASAHKHDEGHGHAHGSPELAEAKACCTKEEVKEKRPKLRYIEVLGAMAGVFFVYLAQHEEPSASAHNEHTSAVSLPESSTFLERLLEVSLEAAPAILLGFFLAGAAVLLLPALSKRWLGENEGLGSTLKGVAFGLPLPICSCGVVPVYQGLVRAGIPASAGFAFLVATPELGIDAVALSLPLLGLKMTLARLVAALFVAMVVGYFLGQLYGKDRLKNIEETPPNREKLSKKKVFNALRFSSVELVDETGPWIVFGLFIAAFLDPQATLPFLTQVSPSLQVVLFGLLGLPLYVCASGATPIAAALLVAGASPGAALAFLLAGPATNVTVWGTLRSLHGKRAPLQFASLVFSLALLAGWSTNWLIPKVQATLSAHEHGHGIIAWASIGVFCVLLLGTALRHGPRALLSPLVGSGHNH